MKNKINIIFLILLIVFSGNLLLAQSNTEWQNINIGNHPGYCLKFVNVNTGFAAVDAVVNNVYKQRIYKTTNKGNNWTQIWESPSYLSNCEGLQLSVINENIIYFYYNNSIYRTTNGGNSWNDINLNVFGNGAKKPLVIKFVSSLTGYISYIDKNIPDNNYPELKIIKSTDGFNTYQQVFGLYGNPSAPFNRVVTDITFSNSNTEFVTISGYYYSTFVPNLKHPLTITSSNGMVNYTVNPEANDIYSDTYEYIQTLPGNPGEQRLLHPYQNPNNLNDPVNGIYCTFDNNKHRISNNYAIYWGGLYFTDNQRGYAYISNKIYKTTNSGLNWDEIHSVYGANQLTRNCLAGYGDIIYVLDGAGSFHRKNINMNLNTFFDNLNSEWKINIDGEDKATPNYYYLSGGYSELIAPAYNVSGQPERIFYKWQNNNMNSPLFNYYFDSPGEISAYYKTKLQSTTENAINIPSQTKAIRDNFGRINSIHTSMGGVFFTKSYNNGSNFTTEEIINDKYSGINSCATENNINPFINEALAIDGYPEHISSERNVVAVWERREGNNVIIDYGQRHSIQFGYPYYWDPRGNPSPYRVTINSGNQNFKAYPKVFAKVMYENFLPDTTYDFLTLIAHLKPGGNNNQLVVTGKKSQGANPQEFIIDGDNIESFSAVRSSIGNNLVVHFSYKKNSHIFYKKVYFGIYYNSIFADSNNNGQGCTLISEGDEQISRFTPDISLRNGRPVIAYRGDCRKLRIISFEGDEPVTETIYNFPIIVRYKYFNGTNEAWSTFVKYNSAGNVFQDEPNVEGSKDALAYVVNFRVANSYFKKFVLIKDYPGYSCNPGIFSGKDAKLVRGSYQGNFGTNSYPTLLTLTQNGSLYDVWKQTFTITNTPSSENPNTNLVGVIRDLDINYYFNLGPIIAKNIICSLEDDLETVVENPVEFNENMISQPFSLSNGDTLLIGGLGSYSYYPGCDFRIKKFDVNLLMKSTNQLQRNLFSDTILYEDSIETEYLRGFIIDNIQNGTDSFYIQLVVAPEDITDGSFLYNNVYSPDEEGGDNPGGTKSRYVFFEKGKSGNNQNIPTEYSLSQNYPNPFNPVTKIQYEIQKEGLVTLKVYDILGREVQNLVNEVKSAGRYAVLLDGSDLSSGVYFYRIESGDFVQVKRMVLLK